MALLLLYWLPANTHSTCIAAPPANNACAISHHLPGTHAYAYSLQAGGFYGEAQPATPPCYVPTDTRTATSCEITLSSRFRRPTFDAILRRAASPHGSLNASVPFSCAGPRGLLLGEVRRVAEHPSEHCPRSASADQFLSVVGGLAVYPLLQLMALG